MMSIEARDDSLGHYDSSTGIFSTPVNGRYEMQLNMNTYASSAQHYFLIFLKVDGIVREQLFHYRNYASGQSFDSSQLTAEVDLTKGQEVTFYVAAYQSTVSYHGRCKFNDQTTGCSFLQGKLTKRY